MCENEAKQWCSMTPAEVEFFREAVRNATIFDDWYMRFFMKDNIPCAQLLIRICLNKPDLVVVKMHVEEELPEQSPIERGARLDIWARDSDDNVYNIEVQSDSRGSSPKRAFHYLARMAIEELPKGVEPEQRPSLYVIFITRSDVIGEGQACYWLCGKTPDGKDSGIDANIVYINGAWKGDDALGMLMKDLKNPDYKSMFYKELSERTQFVKDREEVSKMTEFWQKVLDKGFERGMNKGFEEGKEEGRKEGKEEGRKEGKEEGRKEGKEEGRKEGKAEGKEEGRKEGKEEGKAEGREDMIRDMMSRGASAEMIHQYTGLSFEVIAEIRSKDRTV